MIVGRNLSKLWAVLSWLILTQASMMAAVVYTQHFDYPQGKSGNLSLTAAGLPWSAYQGTAATNITGSASGMYQAPVGSGNPNANLSATGGYLYTRAENSTITSTFALMSEAILTSATWTQTGLNAFVYANASHAQFDVRVLVQIGNQWYASSESLNLNVGDQGKYLNASAANIASHSINYRLDADAANWVHFNFTAGSTMGLGGAVASDLSGAITRVGLYTMQPANASALSMARFDGFMLSEVPEPSRAWLGFLSIVVLMGMRRRVRCPRL